MGETNYIYAPSPELAREFRCRVPMKGTRQLFMTDGMVSDAMKGLNISLSEGEMMKDILQVISVRTDNSPMELSFQSDFHFGNGSSGRILLCSHTFSHSPFVTDEKISITLEENASADFVLMQNEHNAATHNNSFDISIAAGASLKMVFLTLHGGQIHNSISISLNGPKSSCDLNGLYLMDGTQKVSNTISLTHRAPECHSEQLFKGILDDSAVSRFFGLINVVPGAQKTEAFQANHNLLLSNDAKVFSEPQLEIYADDVKCSHGATNGRLDEEELFYLRSRGIPEKEARLLQQLAFAYQVLSKISNEELRERLSNLTEKRLRGEFSDCKNCSKNCC